MARYLRRGAIALAARLRRISGMLEGFAYRVAGSSPSPDVGDDVLADRVRSTLGPLEKRLDLPRVNVMVEHGTAVLHGVVASDRDAVQIAEAALAVPGVHVVESHLHTGFSAGDARPSQGHDVAQPSHAMRELLEAARRQGVAREDREEVVRAVLGAFAGRLPQDERGHVAVHLPNDVKPLFTPPPAGTQALRTVDELVDAVCASCDAVPVVRAEAIVEGVLATLRDLVPEESDDVAAVLPDDLRDMWMTSVAV
ncbi:MAG TPA: DUF2267 domain-containing protein [Acidimicrobiia bacterium]|nr:DUF2267 domain-containing protein [Acidimicrobiia bacterium]